MLKKSWFKIKATLSLGTARERTASFLVLSSGYVDCINFLYQAGVPSFLRGLSSSGYNPPTSEILYAPLTRWKVQIHMHEETADPFA